MFSDHEWITATWIDDNDTVYGLIHMEYHGWSDANPPCTDPFPACWYNVITSVISHNSGLTWKHTLDPPLHLTAAIPYKYFYNQPMFGWRSPSNILFNKNDGYYYVTMTTAPYELQQGGTSIMRTKTLNIPNSWKCLNETSNQFDINIGDNPYTMNDNCYV